MQRKIIQSQEEFYRQALYLLSECAPHSKLFFSRLVQKIRLDISCETPARQMIQEKYQALFSHKELKENFKMSSATILNGALKVKML